MIDEETTKKMDSLIDLFSACFFSQFGVYPKISYDISGKRKNILRPEIIKSLANRSLEKAFPGKYPSGIATKKRDRELVITRQYYFYLCMTRTTATLHETARELGKFSHATVLHGVRCIETIKDTKDVVGLDIIKLVDFELLRYSRENGVPTNV